MFHPFRLAQKGQFSEAELQEFAKKHPNFVAIKEYGNYQTLYNPHYHCWYQVGKTRQSVRNWLAKELHSSEQQVAFSDKRKLKSGPEGYKQYCCKGNGWPNKKQKDPPQEYYNISQDEVFHFHNEFWEENAKQQEDVKGKFKKLRAYLDVNLPNDEDIFPRKVLRSIFMYFKESDELISNHQALNYMEYYMTKRDSEYIDKRVSKLLMYN